jgi:hypothetical protein
MWLLKILEKQLQKQKVQGLGIRLTINDTAKGLCEKYAYEITMLRCVCVWEHSHVLVHACVSNSIYIQAESGTNMS